MTRENKLALVVGFGLILLVGILISDHFSAARTQQAAELTQVADPLDHSRWEDPDLIAIGAGSLTTPQPAGRLNRPANAYEEGSDRWAGEDVRPLDRTATSSPGAIEMGRGPDSGVGLAEAEAEALPYRFHDVRSGESLTSICRRYYGDISLLEELARFNGMEDPNALSAGRRLRIPGAADLVRGSAADSTPPRRGQDREEPAQTYTVREGDSLSEIAQRLLGSAKKYALIFECNRDVLQSPDDIRSGMVLKIPRQAP